MASSELQGESSGATSTILADETTGFVYRSVYEYGPGGSGDESWQFAPKTYWNGAIVPGFRFTFSYNADRVNNVTVYQVESLEFDPKLPPDAFVVSADAAVNVIDHRGGDLRNPKTKVARVSR